MPYASDYWDAEEQARGEVWREFMNVLRPYREIGIEAVRAVAAFYCDADRSRGGGSFLSNLPGIWRDAGDRSSIQEDLANMQLGLEVWDRHSADFTKVIAEHDGVPDDVAYERARDTWFSHGHVHDATSEAWMSVLATVYAEILPAHYSERWDLGRAGATGRLPRGKERRFRVLHWLGTRLQRELRWIPQMELLRSLAAKTWPPDPAQRRPWTYDELAFCDMYYSDQQPCLDVLGGHPGGDDLIDPADLVPAKQEQGLGFSPTLGMNYVGYVIIRAVTIDFVEEVLAFNAFESAKGSLQCEECGQFVPRSFYGPGQRYCTAQCKRRAAKRRQRDRAKARVWARRAIDVE